MIPSFNIAHKYFTFRSFHSGNFSPKHSQFTEFIRFFRIQFSIPKHISWLFWSRSEFPDNFSWWPPFFGSRLTYFSIFGEEKMEKFQLKFTYALKITYFRCKNNAQDIGTQCNLNIFAAGVSKLVFRIWTKTRNWSTVVL